MDPEEQQWHMAVEDPMSLGGLLDRIAQRCESGLGREAARHQGGVDLQGGVNFTAAHKHLRRLLKQNCLQNIMAIQQPVYPDIYLYNLSQLGYCPHAPTAGYSF